MTRGETMVLWSETPLRKKSRSQWTMKKLSSVASGWLWQGLSWGFWDENWMTKGIISAVTAKFDYWPGWLARLPGQATVTGTMELETSGEVPWFYQPQKKSKYSKRQHKIRLIFHIFIRKFLNLRECGWCYQYLIINGMLLKKINCYLQFWLDHHYHHRYQFCDLISNSRVFRYFRLKSSWYPMTPLLKPHWNISSPSL